jgi:hypothetical protein
VFASQEAIADCFGPNPAALALRIEHVTGGLDGRSKAELSTLP